MDAAYPADWQEANNVIHLPVVGQAIVIAYNLAGSPTGVNDTLVNRPISPCRQHSNHSCQQCLCRC